MQTNGKFCFIIMGNLYLYPFMNKYIENLKTEFDLIYWNRDGIEEETIAEKAFEFNYYLDSTSKSTNKLHGYLEFKKFVVKIINENNYEGIVVLQTAAAVLLSKVILKKYSKRYILDIRDYTFEKNFLFYSILKRMIKNSFFSVISSEGYKVFLPEYDYVITHNNRTLDPQKVNRIRYSKRKEKERLVIGFIGYISYQEQQKKLINLMKNDNRFELHFIGKEAESLVDYCIENKVDNVKIRGQFNPEDILEFYSEVDIINNIYGNNSPKLDFALSNKLYFAAEFYMPILVCENTFMEKISTEYGFGCTVDLNDSEISNKLYNYYHGIDWKIFGENCNLFLQKVNDENENFEAKVKGFFKGESND